MQGTENNGKKTNFETFIQHVITGDIYAALADFAIDKSLLNAKNECDGNTALHYAAVYGHSKIVNALIKKGASVDAENTDLHTPLHLAALNGHGETVEKLINAGAKVNAQDKDLRTALHYAAFKGHNEIVEKLINAGADINAQDKDLHTPLQLAVLNGHGEKVEKLINAGAKVNAQDIHHSFFSKLMCFIGLQNESNTETSYKYGKLCHTDSSLYTSLECLAKVTLLGVAAAVATFLVSKAAKSLV